MGTDHKKVILKLLGQWRSVIREQGTSLAGGDLERFDRLTRDCAAIQARLDGLFSAARQAKPDEETLELLREIKDLQAGLIAETEKETCELRDTLGRLRKSRNSLKGYRQTGAKGPRFMSERT